MNSQPPPSLDLSIVTETARVLLAIEQAAQVDRRRSSPDRPGVVGGIEGLLRRGVPRIRDDVIGLLGRVPIRPIDTGRHRATRREES